MRLSGMLQSGGQSNMVMEITTEQFAQFAKRTGLFSNGQVLSGKVVEHTGELIKLLISAKGSEFILQAKADLQVGLNPNKDILFQVKYSNHSYTLTPLFENMGMERNAMKALEMAHLPENETTMKMLGTLMKEGMPIDVNSLQEAYQEVLRYPDASHIDMIELHKLGIPVTKENLLTLDVFKSGEHFLIEGMEDIFLHFSEMISTGEMVWKESGDVLPKLFQTLLGWNENLYADADNILTHPHSKMQYVELENTIPMQKEYGLEKLVISQNEESIPEESLKAMSNPSTILSKEEATLLQEFVRTVNTKDTEGILKQWENPNLRMLVRNHFLDYASVSPKEITKEEITKLYTKLLKLTDSLIEVLDNSPYKNGMLSKSLQNVNQNIQFMNQLNTLYSYIQIPLKLGNQYNNSELLVYTNKRKLTSKDGEVTAFLHLDMAHLGPMDIYVSMRESKVKTNFVLKDDTMLDFLNEHMDMLTKRLEQKGYQMQCTLSKDEKQDSENSTIMKILERSTNRPTLVQYSFDVLA